MTDTVLYHGTLKKLIPSIRLHGLQPRNGKLWKEGPVLVFAADAKHRQKIVAAMIYQISALIEKPFHLMAPDDIVEHGAICVIKDISDFQRAERKSKPIKYLELADYYSEKPVPVDRFMVDDELKSFCAAQFRIWTKLST